jgi:hypothetical protein
MKHFSFFTVLVLLVTVSLLKAPSLHAAAGGKTFQVEIYGGFSLLNPTHLNNRADYDRTFELFYTEDMYSYYHGVAGNLYTYFGRMVGQYNKIKNAFPMGIRLKYNLNSSLSVSLGFKYLSRTRDSSVTHQYDVRIVAPDVAYYDEFSAARENAPYSLFAEGYAPMVGIHYKIGGRRAINLEGYVAAGPLFASCGFSRRRFFRKENVYDYWYERTLTYEIEGKGTGISLDAGLRLNIRVVKNIDLFVEGGYSFQRAGGISGAGSSETEFIDSNSSGYIETEAWEGTWAVVPGVLDDEWGQRYYQYPSNRDGTDGFSDFKLDLSGFQLKVGISFKF